MTVSEAAKKLQDIEKRYTTEQPAEVRPPNDGFIRLLACALIKEYRIQLPDSKNAITELTDSDGSRIIICCEWKKKAVIEDVP